MFKSILSLLLLSSLSFSSILSEIKLSCDLETGWIPVSTFTEFKAPAYFLCGRGESYYASLNPRAEFKGFYAELKYTYYASKFKGKLQFAPYRDVFQNTIGFDYKFIGVGINRDCAHGVYPILFNPYALTAQDGSVTRIFVRIHISNK